MGGREWQKVKRCGDVMMELKASEYKRFEDIKHVRDDETEYWRDRELAPVLGYAQWRNFLK
jgi:DNA-damage-inducible protein D